MLRISTNRRAGLTLEQVLARSMRQRRTQPASPSAAQPQAQAQQEQQTQLGRHARVIPADTPLPTVNQWGASSATAAAAERAMSDMQLGSIQSSQPQQQPQQQQQQQQEPASTAKGALNLSLEERELRLKIDNRERERIAKAPRIRSVPSHSAPLNSQDLASVLVAANRMEDWQAATAAFAAVVQDPTHRITLNDAHLSNLVATCAKCRKPEVIEQLLKVAGSRVAQEERDAPSAAQPKSQSVDIDSLSLSKSILVRMITALGQVELWSDALHALALIQGPRPRDAYHAAIAACETSLMWEQAIGVYSSMPQRAEEAKDSNIPTANAVTHAALISCLELCGKNDLAKSFMLQLPAADQSALTSSYAALIHVWSKRHGKNAIRRF